MKVAVGSKNPAKIKAVEQAFQLIFPKEKLVIAGFDIGSEVSDQPSNDTESIKGAKNRAVKSLKVMKADFGVGIESGFQENNGKIFESIWVYILHKDGREGIGSSIRMQIPKKVFALMKKGDELGIATDKVFNVTNSKHNLGFFGSMTNGVLPRTKACVDAVVSALTAFIHPELF